MLVQLSNNQVTFLPYSISYPTMWQCRVHPCCSDRECNRKPGVSSSSSSSSPCSSPTPPCPSPLAVTRTPRSWPPACATASVCSSSCPLSRQKCTSIPQSEHRLPRGSGRGPSAAKKAGNNVVAAPLGIPIKKNRTRFSKAQSQQDNSLISSLFLTCVTY